METLRIIKTVNNTDLSELLPYIGKKVEIIISPVNDDKAEDNNRSRMFEIIERCSGIVEPWVREELYDR